MASQGSLTWEEAFSLVNGRRGMLHGMPSVRLSDRREGLTLLFLVRLPNTIAFTCGAGPLHGFRCTSGLAGPGPSGATDC